METEFAYSTATPAQVAGTLKELRWYRAFIASACREARDPWQRDFLGTFTRDEAARRLPWMIDQAINRRAGWLDDSHHRGSARPNHLGRYPRRARGDVQMDEWRFARDVNSGVVVRWVPPSLRKDVAKRFPERITTTAD